MLSTAAQGMLVVTLTAAIFCDQHTKRATQTLSVQYTMRWVFTIHHEVGTITLILQIGK